MTTYTTSSVLDQSTDAGFQAWGTEFNAALAAVGLTQTTDTGQIDWTSVTRPSGANTFAGYEIWAFNDTLQSTAPIFIRMHYGTNNYGQAAPGITVQLGTGTDGAGNLTGHTTPECCICQGSAPPNNVSYTSRFCYSATQGYLGVAWKQGAGNGGMDQTFGGMYIMRSNDSTGAPTGEAVIQVAASANNSGWANTNSFACVLNFSSGQLFPQYTPSNYFQSYGSYWALWPLGALSTSDGSDVSVFPGFVNIPKIMATANFGIALYGEIAVGSTVSVAIVGSTPHTFLAVGRNMGCGQAVYNLPPEPSGQPLGHLMLWE